ncbi:translation initiation factor eIF2A [Oryctes borbonicus]|uniref:Translation initiation factor eIF2A n=1 Tax=Oryctes borbonicus TaxID=1629725 RepID=A0A0T6AT42_9SCAR|nr:translation initiation factor eIF2A [Oryctes borbonicus]
MYIASIANDLKIHVWPSGQLVHTYKSSAQGCLKSISWSKDGSWLVLVPNKGAAEIISVRDNIKHLHFIQDIQQPTCAVFQNTTKRNIALGTTTGMVLIYDIKSRNIRKHFPRAPSTIFKVEYCAKDSFLAAACENGEILLYNSVTYNLSASYKLPNSKTVSALCCHPSRRNLIGAGSHEGIVGVWDIHTNKLICHNQAHAATVTDITFSPIRGDLIATIGYDRKLAFYDMSQKVSHVQTILEKSPTAVDFCPDGIGIAVALQDGTINAYDTRQLNEPLYSFKGHNTLIKQIIFQKKFFENNSVDYAFSNDSNDSPEEVSTPRAAETSRQSIDSIGHMFCGDVLPDIPEVQTEVFSDLDAGDSFIDAIGLNSNNATANSARDSLPSISEGIKKVSQILEDSTRPSSLSKSRPESITQFQDVQRRISDTILPNKVIFQSYNPLDTIKAQSTPKLTIDGKCPNIEISPTVPILAKENNLRVDASEHEKMIQTIVRQEIKTELQIFHQQIKYELMDVAAQMRRHMLDLHMSIIKEFVQMESALNKLKDMYNENAFGDDCLVKDNIAWRKH